jgi:hypothetical protein
LPRADSRSDDAERAWASRRAGADREHLVDRAQDDRGAARLLQEQIGVDRGGGGAVAGRERHDRRVGQRRLQLLRDAELPAVHARHHQIEDHDVGAMLAHLAQALAAVRGHQDLDALGGQRLREGVAQLDVVLDQQDPASRWLVQAGHHGWRHGRPRRRVEGRGSE